MAVYPPIEMKAGFLVSQQIEVKMVEPQLVLSWRGRINIASMSEKLGEIFGAQAAHLAQHGAQFAGPPLVVYHETPQVDGTVEAEVCLPVDRELPSTGDLSTRELPGGQVASIIHQGPYDGIPQAWTALHRWIAENGYSLADAPWESYLNDPGEVGDPSQYLTEICQPVNRVGN